MNLSSLRQHAVSIPRQDAFVGTWQPVFWQPDLFSPQRFVIGTIARSSSGEVAFRIMDSPGRIECFFRPRAIKREFAALTAMLKQAVLRGGDPLILGSPNFSIGDACFARGESSQAVADSAFADSVTAARSMPDDKDDQSVGPNTEETRRTVNNFLKTLLGLRFSEVVREEGQTLSEHYLDVSLAPNNGAGSIISACFKSVFTVEMKILRAASDINAYASAQHRDKKALFILEPGPDAKLPPKERKEIADMIGSECWKLEQAGFSTPCQTDAYRLAGDIKEWSAPMLG